MHPNWPVLRMEVTISVLWIIGYMLYHARKDVWPHMKRGYKLLRRELRYSFGEQRPQQRSIGFSENETSSFHTIEETTVSRFTGRETVKVKVITGDEVANPGSRAWW